MKWYQIKDKKPPEWEDVLVCFNANHPNCCDVLAYGFDDRGKPEWYRIDATYRVEPNDWWTRIELPKE